MDSKNSISNLKIILIDDCLQSTRTTMLHDLAYRLPSAVATKSTMLPTVSVNSGSKIPMIVPSFTDNASEFNSSNASSKNMPTDFIDGKDFTRRGKSKKKKKK